MKMPRAGFINVIVNSLILLAVTGVSAFPCSADISAREWFEKNWVEHQAKWSENTRIEWIEEQYDLPTKAELARMRREVPGHPDHPDKLRLQTAERRLVKGPDKITRVVWMGKEGSLRRSESWPAVSQDTDEVITPGLAWTRSGEQLTAIDPKEGYPPGHNYAPVPNSVKNEVALFLRGGFSIRAGSVPLELTKFRERGTKWWANVENEKYGLGLLLEGDWDAADGNGHCNKVTITRLRPSQDEVGRRWEFTDWKYNDVLHQDVAGKVSEYSADGRLISVNRLKSITAVSKEEIKKVFRIPELGYTEDSYRGRVKLTSLYDYRGGGEPKIHFYDPDSDKEEVIKESQLPAEKNYRRFRMLGWVTGGMVILIVAGIVMARRNA